MHCLTTMTWGRERDNHTGVCDQVYGWDICYEDTPQNTHANTQITHAITICSTYQNMQNDLKHGIRSG